MAWITTSVSSADPAIKKILATMASEWRGRRISVNQVEPSWTFMLHGDTGEPTVKRAFADGSNPWQIQKPRYGAPAQIVDAPPYGEIVVVKTGRAGAITIYVPRLDAHDLDNSRDALMEKPSGKNPRLDAALANFGPYAGIAGAIVRAQTKALEKKASADFEGKKTSRRLQRDIDDFLRTKTW